MTDSSHQDYSQRGRLSHQIGLISDELSLWTMDCLTLLGRRHLPAGYWGPDEQADRGPGFLYLTFDDGPCPHTTPWLLELLEAEGVKASFFLIGSRVAAHEHLVERIAMAGHVIGNHSFNHLPMPVLPTSHLEKEIDKTNQRIKEITGQAPALFRPPYGLIDQRAADCLKERQMLPVYWGAVPEDWSKPGPERVVRRVVRRLRHGNLIVLHERRVLSKQTVAAAKAIICKGRQLGYGFAAIPEPGAAS